MQNWPQIYHEWQVCPKMEKCPLSFYVLSLSLIPLEVGCTRKRVFLTLFTKLKRRQLVQLLWYTLWKFEEFQILMCKMFFFSISEPIIIFAAFFKQPKISEMLEKVARQLPPLLRTDPNSQADILASLRSTSSIVLPLLWKVVSEFWTGWDQT